MDKTLNTGRRQTKLLEEEIEALNRKSQSAGQRKKNLLKDHNGVEIDKAKLEQDTQSQVEEQINLTYEEQRLNEESYIGTQNGRGEETTWRYDEESALLILFMYLLFQLEQFLVGFVI